MHSVGTSAPRYEGPEKLCGLAKYIDDYDLPGCLYGATLRSTIAYGRIKAIKFERSFPWRQFVVVTAKDIPGLNAVTLLERDQPLLAGDKVMHPQEPIVLVAHRDRAKAYEALKHIQVEYEALEPVLSIEESLALKQRLYKDDNVFKDILIEKGNLEGGFSSAELVVEGEFRVPHQEQAYIENNGMAAWWSRGTLTVLGSMQCPYYVHSSLMPMFKLPPEKVKVVQATTGGGFGGKEDYPSNIAGHAALLALKAKRPVKLIYDRLEDMAATTKRHPAVMRHRTGVSRTGRLVAQDIEVVMDGGAYVTLSPVVLSRGAIHASGCYECPNVRIRARAVATNTPPNGAFRGFGAPQTLYAAEMQMLKIAKALGVDPLALKRINLLRPGSSTATGQVLKESVGAEEVLERCVAKSRYNHKRIEYAHWNRDPGKPTWRGIGVSLVYHGSGFTGAGEVKLASRAGVALTRRGEVVVLAASTEIGQGTTTMFAQICADSLGVPYHWVTVENPDTSKVPNSGPTVASRTCMIVGGLVRKSALRMKADIERVLGRSLKKEEDLKKAAVRLCAGRPRQDYISEYEKPSEIQWDDAAYRGDAYGAYGYAAVAADIEVDRSTYEIRLARLTMAHEIGKAVNPLLAHGQVIGGAAQGVGWALYELPVFKDGWMRNGQLTNYILPTAMDMPPVDSELVELPYARGPFGAKGVGELPMDAPGPAVAAAVFHATGQLIGKLPILPEDILAAHSNGQAQAQRKG